MVGHIDPAGPTSAEPACTVPGGLLSERQRLIDRLDVAASGIRLRASSSLCLIGREWSQITSSPVVGAETTGPLADVA